MAAKRSELSYLKWFVGDVDIMKEQLSVEEIGELFLATMDYLKDGTVKEVSAAIRYPYADCRKKVDRSREAYEGKCATLAKNGAKGGKAKAQGTKAEKGTAKAQAPTTAFIPPTKKQFYAAIEHAVEEGEMADSIKEYEIDVFYESLVEAGWTIEGVPLQKRSDWESFLSVRFPTEEKAAKMRQMGYLFLRAYKFLFKTFHGLRNEEGDTMADFVAADFIEEYEEDNKGWTIDNEQFLQAQWQEAIVKYAKQQDDIVFGEA